MARFELTTGSVDPALLRAALDDPAAGACACFEGWVRNHHGGRAVRGLNYEAYEPLARREGERILNEGMRRFDLCDARGVHRLGELGIGELAVWVGVSSGHRDAAFAGCRWIIDEIKQRVPIWKHERYVDGDATWLGAEDTGQKTEQ